MHGGEGQVVWAGAIRLRTTLISRRPRGGGNERDDLGIHCHGVVVPMVTTHMQRLGPLQRICPVLQHRLPLIIGPVGTISRDAEALLGVSQRLLGLCVFCLVKCGD